MCVCKFSRSIRKLFTAAIDRLDPKLSRGSEITSPTQIEMRGRRFSDPRDSSTSADFFTSDRVRSVADLFPVLNPRLKGLIAQKFVRVAIEAH